MDNLLLQLTSALQTLDEAQQNTASDSGIFGNLISQLQAIIQSIIDSALTSISGYVNSTESNISNAIDGVVQNITDTAETVQDNVTEFVSGVETNITDKVTAVKDNITTAIATTETNVTNKVNDVINTVTSTASDLWNDISFAVSNVETNIESQINSSLGGLASAFREAIGWIRDSLSSLIDKLSSVGTQIANSVSDAVKQVALNIGDAIGNIVDSLTTKLGDTLVILTDKISNLINTVQSSIGEIANKLKESVIKVGEKLKEGIISGVDKLKEAYENAKVTIEKLLNKFLLWLGALRDEIINHLYEMLNKFGGWLNESFLPAWGDAVNWAQKISGLDESDLEGIKSGDLNILNDAIGHVLNEGAQAAINSPLFSLATSVALFWQSVGVQFVPMQVKAQKEAIINLQMEALSLDESAISVLRGYMSNDEYFENARLQGISKDKAQIILQTSKQIVSPGEAQTAFLRGLISEKEHDKIISKNGFSKSQIKLFKQLYNVLPGLNDIITMAVKEAFSPKIAETFGQYEDFPEEFAHFAKQAGLSEEWAKRYWAAHWGLPSPNMGFEMFQRGIVSEDELKLLLKALDIMPFWREKIIKLSYQPITRVDIRRMYKMSLLTDDELYQRYLQIGYSPEDAAKMVEFTKVYSAPEDENTNDEFRILARSTYSAAYRKNIISKDEYYQFLISANYNEHDANLLIAIDDFTISTDAKLFNLEDYKKDYQKVVLNGYDRGILARHEVVNMLETVGYSEDEANLQINLIDYNRQLALEALVTKQVAEQYITRTIDATQVQNYLNTFNFTDLQISKLLEEWNVERNIRTRKPTLSQIKQFFLNGLITLEQMKEEIRGLGYPERYVNLYVQLYSM